MQAENLARFFHTTYEALAPQFNYQTRKASAVPWQDVPENNKRLMIAVAEQVILLFESEAKAEKIARQTLSIDEAFSKLNALEESYRKHFGDIPPITERCKGQKGHL